jgi:hypothetical protein
MNKRVEETIDRWKKIKFISLIVFISGITEEILKRRRRTTLAISAVISLLLLFYLK